MTAAAMPNPIGAKEAKTIQDATLTVATGTDTLSILLVRTASIYTNRKPVGSYPRRPLALAADDDHERDEDADHHYGERDEGIASVGDQQSEQAVPHVALLCRSVPGRGRPAGEDILAALLQP